MQPKLSKHTQFKVIGGYTLLFLLTIFSTILIYRQITKLIVNEENVSDANRKLFIVGNTITGLYEAETLGNAFIQTGLSSYFRQYMSIMDVTEANIDSLRDLTTRLDQLLRIDTISNLLENKIRNMKDLVYVKRSFVPEEFYNKAIATIESDKDSLKKESNVRKRYVTTLDSTYVKNENKKRRWFSRAQPDSVLTVTKTQHVIVDTLNYSLRNTDTVVNILRSTWEDVQKQTQTITKQINRKEYALIKQSTVITDQLRRILGEYEKEEINHAYLKQYNREQTITTMIRIFALVAAISFLLVVFFTFFILRDLSRSQRYRRELESANRYTAQLLESREKMILTVTHDIKSPLSSIIGYIELLRNTPVNDRQSYFLKNMQGSSEHILKLIGNLLDLSKLENNKIIIEEVIFQPARLFQEITDTFIPLASAKHLELQSKFGADLNQDYKGDALRIRQIVTNILSNAIKYTTEGSVSFTATSSTDDKQIMLKIRDTGSGMTPEEQKLIFQEFTRLKSHSAIEGTGLGLTITLKLIHLLQGKIKLQSEPGKGSCFTITLPLRKVLSTEKRPSNISNFLPKTELSGLKILLVDDDLLQLEMTVGLLSHYGIQTDITTQPEKVLHKLQTEHYDLVFSDIQMPGMSGLELVKQIRQYPGSRFSQLPVVALSADSDKQESDYQQAGFTSYLSKPFNSNQLIQLICRLTNNKMAPQQNQVSESQLPDSRGYTLSNIRMFTDNDPEALKKIIGSFLANTREHLILLEKYQNEKQWKALSQLAHKMLPIFRQIEATAIVEILQYLEHPEKEQLTEKDMGQFTEKVIPQIKKLLENLEKDT